MRLMFVALLTLTSGGVAWADAGPIETADTSDPQDSGDSGDGDEDDGGCFGGGKAALSLGLLMIYGLRKRR